jgi:serine/threonine protein kinase, bacterial
MSFASGATFVGYTILRPLGRDEMGDVYLAQHPRLPQWNALRILSAALAEDHEYRDRFLRESPVATNLYHPHIHRVEFRGESDGQLWFTAEYIKGIDAAQWIATRCPNGMPLGEVLAVVTAIADALDYAHSRGMLHRGVKPASILFANPADGEQQILLTEFGIARYVGDPDGPSAPDLTADSVAYAAPEQLTGSTLDGRADQYSLAATTYHLLTGRPPFDQSNPVAVISQHLTAPPPSLRDRRPDAARLDSAFAVALAKNPRDRFASCRAFADALSHGAGAWTGDRSPEAYLTVVEYPDDHDDLPVHAQPAYAAESADAVPPFSSWAAVVQRLADHHAKDSEVPGDVGSPVSHGPTLRRRWPWVVAAGSAAAALAVGLVVVGVLIGRENDNTFAQGSAPLTPYRPALKAPPPPNHDFPGPGEALDGSYRIDVNREQQVYNGTPDSQPPNVTTYWAFRTACTPKSCVATGTMLDQKDHQHPSAIDGNHIVVMDFRNGAWHSRPQTMQFACLDANGTASHESTTQVLSLLHTQGALSGTMTVTVESDECGQLGAKIEIPTVAGRIADVPAGVEVPSPPSISPATPAKPGR